MTKRDHYGAMTLSAFRCESGQKLCGRHDDWIADSNYKGGEWRVAPLDTDTSMIAPGGAVLVDTDTGEPHYAAGIASRKAWHLVDNYHAWLTDALDPTQEADGSFNYRRKYLTMPLRRYNVRMKG